MLCNQPNILTHFHHSSAEAASIVKRFMFTGLATADSYGYPQRIFILSKGVFNFHFPFCNQRTSKPFLLPTSGGYRFIQYKFSGYIMRSCTCSWCMAAASIIYQAQCDLHSCKARVCNSQSVPSKKVFLC